MGDVGNFLQPCPQQGGIPNWGQGWGHQPSQYGPRIGEGQQGGYRGPYGSDRGQNGYHQEPPRALKYDGKTDFETFWGKFRRYVQQYRLEDLETIIFQLSLCLKDIAADRLEEVLQRGVGTLAELERALRRRFGGNELPSVSLMKFRQAQRERGESRIPLRSRGLSLGGRTCNRIE